MRKANASSQGRRLELDAVRGLMLVWMALTHLPTRLPAHVNQPFGFISATEGFIFLSALFTGCIFFRLAEREGYDVMLRKLWTRSLRLYMYHGLLLVFAFLVAVPFAAHGDRPGLHNLLNFLATLAAMFVTAIMFLKYEDEGGLLVLPSALEWNRALIPEEKLHPRRLKLAAGS